MNKGLKFIAILASFQWCACTETEQVSLSYSSETLKIEQISPHIYQHISYINLPEYGKFPCNGLIYLHDNKAIIFDTPIDDASSNELLYWVQDQMHIQIKAVIVHHFHVDCLGGLQAFHQAGIPSYASEKTIALAKNEHPSIPQNSFKDSLNLALGNQYIQTQYFGAGHTQDNVVSYIPEDSTLFGGCLIKEMDAGKGNLEDADSNQWPITVRAIQNYHWPIVRVVPGHGKTGGPELFNYTHQLFSN